MKNWIILISLLQASSIWAVEPLSADTLAKEQVTVATPANRKEQLTQEVTAKIREKLSPLVQTTLDEHCGKDCPGFRIDSHFKKTLTKNFLEDLGFSRTTEPEEAQPELQSVTLSVLIQNEVPQSSKETLKQILSEKTSNASSVPVQVQLKAVHGVSPSLHRKLNEQTTPELPADHQMEIFNTLIWPSSLLIITLLGIFGLILFLKNRRDLLRDQILARQDSEKIQGSDLIANDQKSPLFAEAFQLLESRKDDLQWLIEDLALKNDLKSLEKVLSLYPPQELSARLKFSSLTLKRFTEFSPASAKTQAQEALPWLKDSLKGVHWRRLHEQQFPLSKLGRLSDAQKSLIFGELQSDLERAAFLSSIPEESWPVLLSQRSSQQRIELGLSLSQYQDSTPQDRNQWSLHLSDQFTQILEKASASSMNWLESFTLYLTENEAQSFWKELDQRKPKDPSQKHAVLSMDSIVQELDPQAATEIFTSLEVGSLGALIQQLSGEAQKKVLLSLPKTLRDRVSHLRETSHSTLNEAQLMRARAQMLEAYRKFTAVGGVQ